MSVVCVRRFTAAMAAAKTDKCINSFRKVVIDTGFGRWFRKKLYIT